MFEPRNPQWIIHVSRSHYNDFIKHRGLWATIDDRRLEPKDPVAFLLDGTDEMVFGRVKLYGKVRLIGEARAKVPDMGDWYATCYEEVSAPLHSAHLTYFKSSGKFSTNGKIEVPNFWNLFHVWDFVEELQNSGRLPGLIAGAGKKYTISVDVPGHPHEHLHLIIPQRLEKERMLKELYRELQELKRPATAIVLREMFDLEIESEE